MPHSSQGVRRDKYRCEDPLRINEEMEKEIKNYFQDSPENELNKRSPCLPTDEDIPALKE